jgi:hypothetical protein
VGDDDTATVDEPTLDDAVAELDPTPAEPAAIDAEREAYYAPDPEPDKVDADLEREAYYAPDGAPEAEPDADADDADTISEAMSKDDLVAEAEARGLAVSGTKAELVARIEEHDAAEPEPEVNGG